jgi:hypothetical protein
MKFSTLNSIDTGNSVQKRLYNWMNLIGIGFIVVGGLVLVLGMVGVIDLDVFAFGISAGVRVVGTLAITGCLLSAIACFALEFNNDKS